MMDRLKKLRDKKGVSKMHPLEQKAKMDVVGNLQKMAEDAMGSKLKGMNKVTVAADSPEGLEHGLSEAHDVLGNLPEALDDSNPDHESFDHSEAPEDDEDGMSAYPDADEASEESHEDVSPMYDHMDDSELDQHLKHLLALKAKKGLA